MGVVAVVVAWGSGEASLVVTTAAYTAEEGEEEEEEGLEVALMNLHLALKSLLPLSTSPHRRQEALQ